MQNGVVFSIVTLLAAVFLSPVACQAAMPSLTQTGAPDLSKRTITVLGEGSVTAKPDIARINLGVEIVSQTLADAMKQNTTRTTAVIAKLKSLGVADKDIQTTNLSVNVERNFEKGSLGPITGYRVANTVVAVIRELNKISDLLDQAIQAGANNIYGISFNIENSTKQEAEARAKAVADAQARADDIAKLNGVQRGDLIFLSEGSSPTTFSSSAAPVALGLGGGGGGPPVEPGSLEIRVRVQITYFIK